MANLHKLTVQEALNSTGPGGVWTTNAAATHGGTGTTDTIHLDVSGASQLGIYAAGSIYFRFSADEGVDCNTSNDLIIPGSTLTFITVPRGLGSTIYFNHLGLSAVAVRIVEV
tara:strand:+ start:1996 stop:2334 length:339 start_codon:yes stop_codon:yes gene_type:complete